ncbi:GNAT family N-acetyltransferase [Thermoactinospora rubra]|uniref:GNAT family N-acetyltransferase n=1 Tax=Thermoactinospora rubra TaxID=1088767 RepID=UPI000A0F4DE9|nr:GNAT family N-acetyltransferase [Thermoactinospora rubra]
MTSESPRLRPAVPGDYDRIVAVVDDWWGRPVRSNLPRLFLDHFHRTSLVAENAGEPAGFLVGFLSPSMPDCAYIHFAGVAPPFRGGGLARRLYESFFALAAAGHRTRVRAITSPRNSASIAFHTAMGFSVTGPVAGYDGPAVDRVVFDKRLPRP